MEGYRFFDAAVLETVRLSPSMQRLVLGGEGLELIPRAAPDLYLKIFFPTARAALSALDRGGDWYARWLRLPPARRVPMRTLTVRAVQPGRQALVIDFALHEAPGPASDWVRRARVGDPLVLYAPLQPRWGRGYAWRLPRAVRHVLVLGDACAVPAAAGIIESLAEDPAAPALTALLEVAEPGDRLPLLPGKQAQVHWHVRRQGDGLQACGLALREAVARWLGRPVPRGAAGWDREQPLWELAGAGAATSYAWVAAEAGVAAELRRWLIEAGMSRDAVSCMGYWRRGRAQV